MRPAFFIVILSLGLCAHINAQSLAGFKWKNRILLVLGDQTNTDKILLKKYELLKSDLEERNLLIVTANTKKAQIISPYQFKIKPNIFNYYSKEGNGQRILLIGLDGTIKASANEIFFPKELFKIIDSMPMRASEIKRKNE